MQSDPVSDDGDSHQETPEALTVGPGRMAAGVDPGASPDVEPGAALTRRPVGRDKAGGPAVLMRSLLIVVLPVVGFIAAVLITVGLVESPLQQSEAVYWQNHTLEVLGAAARLEADIERTIAEGRGFLIDRARDSITRFEAAKLSVSVDQAALRQLTVDNPVQFRRLGVLETLVTARIAILSDVIEQLQHGDEEHLFRNIRQKSGISLMAPIEAAIAELVATERDLLVQRNATLRRASQRTLFTMIGCSLAVTATGVITIFLLLGQARKRRHVEHLQLLAADLEKRVKERTSALTASELRFRMLSEYGSDVVSLVGRDGKRIYVSPAVARVVGVSPEEFIARGLRAFAVAEDAPRLEAATQRLLTGETDEARIRFRIRRADGAEVWLDTIARLVPDPVSGTASGYMSVSRDITEEHSAAVALQASEARYRALSENVPDVIVVLDVDLVRTYVSPAYRAIFGYEVHEILAGQARDVIHPDDADDLLAHMRRVACGQAERGQETYRHRHKNGHWVWVEVNFSLLRDYTTGRPASIITSTRDVSDRHAQGEALLSANVALARARDEAEQANLAKSRFLAAMSHELRTPLNGILGYTQLLKLEGGLNPTQQARVASMLEAGAHLLEMINRVLELSQIEKEHGVPQRNATNLRDVMHAALEVVRPLAQAKGLRLDVAEMPGVPRCIMTDATRVRQVLLNLLGNAVKYTSAGAVTLRLRPISDGAAVRIEVKDTGPGIPADRRSRLFQDFERLGIESDGVVEGAGIGLALSARLAAMMGGHVGHRDNPEGGSVFWLDVPIGERVAEPAPAVAVAVSQPAVQPGPLKVLVVDDVAMNRDIAGSFLVAGGHAVTYAAGGLEAVAVAGTMDFDVVLMDVRMPEVDGLEATRRIRGLTGSRGRVPIIALTAQAFAEQVADCRKAGMDSHLAKPFVNVDLLAAVAQAATLRGNEAGAASRGASGDDGRGMNRPAVVVDASLPVIDVTRFKKNAAFLEEDKVVSSLLGLADQCGRLRDELEGEGSVEQWEGGVAESAHMLAGSAGMFGFARLADVAGRFEHAVQTEAGNGSELASSLVAVIDASMVEINRLLPEGARNG